MAREYGIEDFCYWHYWFAGRRILERPYKEMLESGRPEFPFCLAWANQTWSGIWYDEADRVLIKQTYPGADATPIASTSSTSFQRSGVVATSESRASRSSISSVPSCILSQRHLWSGGREWRPRRALRASIS